MKYIDVTHLACQCAACQNESGDRGERTSFTNSSWTAGDFITPLSASLDPDAGGTYRDKPIYSVEEVEEQLNRTGYDWYTNNYNELDDGVLNFGFWNTRAELQNSYYTNDDGTMAFTEVSRFVTFTAAQRDLARASIQLWDDLVNIRFQETAVADADITFGNVNQPNTQAYAYLPFGNIYDQAYEENYNWSDIGRLSGDVWIGYQAASNFNPLTDGYYAKTTMVHEIGHAIALSHPGDYNASDTNPINYEFSAEYAQDSRQYSIMSYWEAYETGAQHIDWALLNFAYAATPMVHDIAAIQAIYGADPLTRLGETVYGFNSTAGRSAYDFTVNTRPVISIYDAGGNDTLDFSGWNTPSIINLNEGSFSSGGGVEEFLTLEEVNAARAAAGFAARTQATFDFYEDLKEQLGLTSGLFKDNISIAYGTVIENAVGGGGDDLIIANSAANRLDGGAGRDTVSYETATSAVTVSLATGLGSGGAAGDVLLNIENLRGSAFGDTLTGDAGNNVINGGAGNDILRGGGGNDVFVFNTNQSIGSDRILDFSAGDRIATDKKIADLDGDGIVFANRSGVLTLDSDGDSVRFEGTNVSSGFRYLGEVDGLHVYGLASDPTTTTMISPINDLAF